MLRKIATTILVSGIILNISLLHAQRIPGEYLIQLRSGTNATAWLRSFREKDAITKPFDITRQVSARMQIYLCTSKSNIETNTMILGYLQRDPEVLNAQYNHRISRRISPDDSLFMNQYSLLNTGQQGGLAGADIDATLAWAIQTGGLTARGDTIVVAVIDGGIDLNHPDLKANIWKNHEEIPANGLDDDQNGYVDDFMGWNFLTQNDTLDADWHGTSVAGIIGASGNNQIGVSGINWNIKILAVEAGVSEAEAIESYSYVMDFRRKYNSSNGTSGAFVVSVNSSWGIDLGQPANYPIWCAMYDSMGQAGILNCAATANHNWNIDSLGDMPTACPSDWLISVTNTTRNDLKEYQAGYGDSTIDLGAPGTGTFTTNPFNDYGYFGGTSGATPHVAGSIALLYASSCKDLIDDAKNSPGAVALTVKSYILNGVDTLADLQGKTKTGGRLNVYQSLIKAENYGSCTFTPIGLPLIAQPGNTFHLYPNPSGSEIFLKAENPAKLPDVIGIYDLQGRLIETLQNQHESSVLSIDLRHYKAGLYFIETGNAHLPFVKL